MTAAIARNWPEYLMEGALLGCFMLSACAFSVLLGHPGSPAVHAVPHPDLRRALVGVVMGLTAISLIYSPWGKQSGAHMNPATTLTFWRLGKVRTVDAAFYTLCQFVGAAIGVFMARLVLGKAVADPPINYAVTVPGASGAAVAWLAEAVISFGMMTLVLNVSNSQRLAGRTGLFAGALVALYITFEAPISGMSMNPARTFGSAFSASFWEAWWIYFTAPPLGMLLASELFVRTKGASAAGCCKLHHQNRYRCIHCGKPVDAPASAPSTPAS
jgi:aquaporin Z